MTNQDQIKHLLNKLDVLLKKQDAFAAEINQLRREIHQLKAQSEQVSQAKQPQPEKTPTQVSANSGHRKEEEAAPKASVSPKANQPSFVKKENPKANKKKAKTDIEKFIGENLINKIGIIITVIGVAIGAKYAIDNELISPLTRIILGYVMGIGLLAFAIKLKKKYDNFSAVLLSGSMAIMYFITFAAYDFYALIPQSVTFLLMLVFTVFTVIAAIQYNRQVIAHIGLIGAYAVPFLLSDGSGQVAVLFSYMAIINIGILSISLKKYWKSLYFSAFAITWIIYMSWFFDRYQNDNHFGLAFLFLMLFFLIFYVTFLAYKFIKKETFTIANIILLLLNSFIAFGLGYSILNEHDTNQFLGIFTLANAAVHFIVCSIIYRKKLADKNLFYLIAGLVLVFITIAIPIQLDGNWVTLLWAGEAALLFWIGRTKTITVYEKLSYPLMMLAFVSLLHDWFVSYRISLSTTITPILNIHFLTSIIFVAAFAFITYIHQHQKYSSTLKNHGIYPLIALSIPTILLVSVYYAFRLEIINYWDALYSQSSIELPYENTTYPSIHKNNDLPFFKSIWLFNYSLGFVAILGLVNNKKLQLKRLGYAQLIFSFIFILSFLVQGLYLLSELRESYLKGSEYYEQSLFHIGIRYLTFAFVAFSFLLIYQCIQQKFMNLKLKVAFDCLLYIAIIWIASSELINWMDIAGYSNLYKLGLSILWGCCSLSLIIIGIWKKKKHLRIGAIILFAITLLKLFFYDISHLNTIAKTIIFVALGILLLIISFLYNKYKHIIADENPTST